MRSGPVFEIMSLTSSFSLVGKILSRNSRINQMAILRLVPRWSGYLATCVGFGGTGRRKSYGGIGIGSLSSGSAQI